MLLPEQLRTFSQSVKQPGQWAAHLIRGVDIPVACYTCTETLAQIYQRKSLRIENRQEKKDILPTAGRERKREGGKEGRKEDGRKKKTKRNEGLAPKCCVRFPMYTCYFQRVAGPKQFANVGFKMWERLCSLQMLAATRCKQNTMPRCAKSADDHFKMLRIPSTCRFDLQKVVKIASG